MVQILGAAELAEEFRATYPHMGTRQVGLRPFGFLGQTSWLQQAGRAVALDSAPPTVAARQAFGVHDDRQGCSGRRSLWLFRRVWARAASSQHYVARILAGRSLREWALRANVTVRDRAGCMSCLLPLSQQLRTAWAAGGMRLSRVITLVLLRVRWVHG
jgi:hypothetical protein